MSKTDRCGIRSGMVESWKIVIPWPAREDDSVELAATTDKDGLPSGGMWNHLLIMALGVWLMAAPDVMGYEGPERVVDQIAGPPGSEHGHYRHG